MATRGDPAAPAAYPVAAVAALTPTLRAGCADTDRTRALPAAVAAALREAGVFRLLVPRDVGGAEADPVTVLAVVEAAAHADGSVGWCVMAGACTGAFAGMLPLAGAQAIFGDPAAIGAGNFRRDGVAHEVAGGYRVTGRWTLGSGSSHATWYVAGCQVHRDGQPVVGPAGAPLVREVFVPAAAVEVLDTWESTGLRGTASHDYAVTDVFVPAAHTAWFQDPPRCPGALYRLPPIALFAAVIGAVPLGIARHALEAFAALAAAKPRLSADRTRVDRTLADLPVAQAAYGRAHARVAAGRAYLTQTVADLWGRVQAGHAPGLADRGALWLAATHAAHSALEAIDALYTTAGASAVYAGCPLDRCLRDARTAAQHVCTQEANFELAGQRLLGRAAAPGVWGLDDRGEDRPPPTGAGAPAPPDAATAGPGPAR